MSPYDDIFELPRTVRMSYAVVSNREGARTLRAKGKISEFHRAIGLHDDDGLNYVLVKQDSWAEAKWLADELRPFLPPGSRVVVKHLRHE